MGCKNPLKYKTMDIQTFLNKLNKFNYTSYKDNTIIGINKSNIIVVSFRTEIATNSFDIKNLPLQAVISVRINDAHVITYGSDSIECNSEMVNWFVTNKATAGKNENDKEKEYTNKAKGIFTLL